MCKMQILRLSYTLSYFPAYEMYLGVYATGEPYLRKQGLA